MSIGTTFGHINALILENTMAKSQNEPHRKLNKKNSSKFCCHCVGEKNPHTKVTKFEI